MRCGAASSLCRLHSAALRTATAAVDASACAWACRIESFPGYAAGRGAAGGSVDALSCVGRPSGFAAVGLLQVRAFALIPFGDGLRPPCASLTQRLRRSTSTDQTCLRQVRALAARRFLYASASVAGCRLPAFFALSGDSAPAGLGDRLRLQGGFHKASLYKPSPLLPRPRGRCRSPGEELRKTAASSG